MGTPNLSYLHGRPSNIHAVWMHFRCSGLLEQAFPGIYDVCKANRYTHPRFCRVRCQLLFFRGERLCGMHCPQLLQEHVEVARYNVCPSDFGGEAVDHGWCRASQWWRCEGWGIYRCIGCIVCQRSCLGDSWVMLFTNFNDFCNLLFFKPFNEGAISWNCFTECRCKNGHSFQKSNVNVKMGQIITKRADICSLWRWLNPLDMDNSNADT